MNPFSACALPNPSTGSETVLVDAEEVRGPSSTPILKLRQKKKEEDKKSVAWTSETVKRGRK